MKTEELEAEREARYSTSVEAVIAPDSAILWRSLDAALSFGVGGAESVVVGEKGVDAPDWRGETMARVCARQGGRGMRLSEIRHRVLFAAGVVGGWLRGNTFVSGPRPKWCKVCKRWRYVQPRDRVLASASRAAFLALRYSECLSRPSGSLRTTTSYCSYSNTQ